MCRTDTSALEGARGLQSIGTQEGGTLSTLFRESNSNLRPCELTCKDELLFTGHFSGRNAIYWVYLGLFLTAC